MFSDSAETLKRQFTDKYVAVDATRPELARFRDVVGQVKTVNMSGRALVEFLDYHLNIGWFDIDVSALKIVDKPPPKVEKKAEARKPAAAPAAKAAPAAGEKKLSPLEMARAQGASGAAKPAAPTKPAGEKKSVSDILAAARGGSAPPTSAPGSAGGSSPVAKSAPPAAKPKSTADILAAARGGKTAPAAGATVPAPATSAAAPAEPEPKAAEEPAEEAHAKAVVKVDRNSMSVEEMIAYCRKIDHQ